MDKDMQVELRTNRLLSSAIAVGHCVILNDVEQPCGKLVAVIMSIEGETAYCNYLNADPMLSSYNKKLGMAISLKDSMHNLTPVGWFGVEVVLDKKFYWCVQTSESRATYKDGKRRFWQEREPIIYTVRKNVAAVATSG